MGYTPDTVWTTAPQEDTQITWLADPDQEDGDGGTRYSMYGLANKRASNYGNCGPLQTGSCSSSLDAPERSTAGSVTVANLNIIVAEALATATSAATSYDESSAAIAEIRDAVNTINAQAAQRYIARISLDANNPGNGMGGSTKRAVAVALPAGIPDNTVPTACGGGAYVPTGAAPDATPSVARRGTALTASLGAVGFANIGKNVATVPPATDGAYATGTYINAPCDSTASATGTAASNTATMGSVMNVITQAATNSAPYQVAGTAALAGGAAVATAGQIASTNTAITAATRGEATYTPGKDYSKIAPTGCIGPDVYFSNVMATTITNKKTVYSFCNPDGYKGSAVSTFTLAENMNLYVKAAGTDVAGVDTYVKKTIGSVHTYAALDANEVAAMRQVWDPIMAAQLTDGGFCCNAQYYGPDGTGRAQPYFQPAGSSATTAVGNNAAVPAGTALPTGSGLLATFVPPLSGGDMSALDSPGIMCPAHGSGNGKTAKTVANIALDNPAMKELLEGQAFYAALAPSQYNIPTTSTTATTQAANAKKQKMCADHITKMMKLNKVAASTPTGTAGAASVFKYAYSAVEFPLWKVAIGPSDNAVFTVPNGYCYANACFDDFAKVGTQSTFKGTEKLGELVSGPNMAAVDSAGAACGRANSACAAAPATWNGGPAVMNKAGCTATTCTAAGVLNTTGAIPVA